MVEFLIGACGILGSLVCTAALVGVSLWLISRSRESRRRLAEPLVRRWAESQNDQIVALANVFWWESPFYSSEGQVVYRLTVQDRDGRPRRGWIRSGGLFLGLLSDRVDLLWQDEC